MIRKCFVLISLLMVVSVGFSNEKPKKFCAKRCFNMCKQKGQAVKGCRIYNVTTISFSVDCQCRELNKGEKLPDSAPNYLINTRSGVHLN